jgi:hypothetical protein
LYECGYAIRAIALATDAELLRGVPAEAQVRLDAAGGGRDPHEREQLRVRLVGARAPDLGAPGARVEVGGGWGAREVEPLGAVVVPEDVRRGRRPVPSQDANTVPPDS